MNASRTQRLARTITYVSIAALDLTAFALLFQH